MKKAIICLLLVGTMFCVAPSTRADTGDLIDRGTDVLDCANRVLRLLADATNPFAIASDCIDILIGGVRGVRGEMSRREMNALKEAVRQLQVACGDIPELRKQLASIRNQLDDKADKKEVERLFKEFRADLDAVKARLGVVEGKVANLEIEGEKTKKTLGNHRQELDDHGRQLTVLNMQAMKDGHGETKANLLLSSGHQVRDVTLVRCNEKGVIIRRGGEEEVIYKPGQVESITVMLGKHVWNPSKQEFVFHSDKDSTVFAGKNPEKLTKLKDTSQDRQNAELDTLIYSLNPDDAAQFHAYAERRFRQEWTSIDEPNKRKAMSVWIYNKHQERVQKLMHDTNCQSEVAIRQIVHELVEKLPKSTSESLSSR